MASKVLRSFLQCQQLLISLDLAILEVYSSFNDSVGMKRHQISVPVTHVAHQLIRWIKIEAFPLFSTV